MPDKVIIINESCTYYEIYYNRSSYWHKCSRVNGIIFGYYDEFYGGEIKKIYYAM